MLSRYISSCHLLKYCMKSMKGKFFKKVHASLLLLVALTFVSVVNIEDRSRSNIRRSIQDN